MISRPLDLASKLRPEPRSLDWLFFVNGGLLVLFFSLFGSRFVLSPGLGADFKLPEAPGASASARLTTQVITVMNAGQIFIPEGNLSNLDQLQAWLNAQATKERHPALLIRASTGVPMGLTVRIMAMARAAGFQVTFAAEDPGKNSGAGGSP